MALARALRSVPARVRAPAGLVVAFRSLAAAPALGLRAFSVSRVSRSDESHDDFKPKLKTSTDSKTAIHDTIEKAVKSNKAFLFMKGTPQQPMCGFSAQVVRVLNAHGIEFASMNVLESPEIRQGVKDFSNWPTFPQFYVNGEFVGGCDIVTSMHNAGELDELFKSAGLSK